MSTQRTDRCCKKCKDQPEYGSVPVPCEQCTCHTTTDESVVGELEKEYRASWGEGVEDMRLWNEFIVPALTSQSTQHKAEVEKAVTSTLEEMLEYTHFGEQFIEGVRTLIDAREIRLQALTPKES